MTNPDESHPFPDGIDDRNVSPVAGWQRHASPLGLIVFGVVVVLALVGVLGHERTWAASGGGVDLEVHAPEVIRNGEFFELRVRVRADDAVDELVIGVDESLWEDVTVNTMIPAASDEVSEDGEVRFTFAELSAGTEFLLKIDLQVNPDIIAGNDGAITVYDGDERLTAADLTITVLP
ncbi:MAG TPA: hypothetical protein VF367_06515 [Candidatus Limnocylindria bacterium]|jgi:hypothetical protein